MPSQSYEKFVRQIAGAKIIRSFHNQISSETTDATAVEQICLCAAVAQAVGCWEGYIEGAIREFVTKTRIMAQRRSWPLIIQFEALVDKLASELNTPNWDKTRELLIVITGMDPHPAWVWAPKFSNSTDTKQFFDGLMQVRHSFAHGFSVPHGTPGLTVPGRLDASYVNDAIDCITFFTHKTDELLEHELRTRHGCPSGWS